MGAKGEKLSRTSIEISRSTIRTELPALQPMHCSRVNRDCFFSANVRAIFQVTMLPLLFSLEVQSS